MNASLQAPQGCPSASFPSSHRSAPWEERALTHGSAQTSNLGVQTRCFSWPPAVMSGRLQTPAGACFSPPGIPPSTSCSSRQGHPTGPPGLARSTWSPQFPQSLHLKQHACTHARACIGTCTRARAHRCACTQDTRACTDACIHRRVHTQAHTHTHILRDPDGCAGYVIALPASLFLEYVAFLLPNLMGLRRLSRGSGTPASGFFIRPQFRAAAVAGVGK